MSSNSEPPVTVVGALLGKQRTDAAVEVGVQHIASSALENVEKITDGEKWAPHFTDKARIEECIRRLPVVSSIVHLAFLTPI